MDNILILDTYEDVMKSIFVAIKWEDLYYKYFHELGENFMIETGITGYTLGKEGIRFYIKESINLINIFLKLFPVSTIKIGYHKSLMDLKTFTVFFQKEEIKDVDMLIISDTLLEELSNLIPHKYVSKVEIVTQ
jgi:hypothetical protein